MTTSEEERFAFRETKDRRVQIFCDGRLVATLAGARAVRFLERVAGADAEAAQLEMAKATGNFKRGNERAGRP